MQCLTAALLLLSVTPVLAQSGIENITLEAWIIIGVLTLGVGGLVGFIWIIFIYCICKIKQTHKEVKRHMKLRSLYRRQRDRRQPAVTNAELRAVVLRTTDNQTSPHNYRPREPAARPYVQPQVPSRDYYGLAELGRPGTTPNRSSTDRTAYGATRNGIVRPSSNTSNPSLPRPSSTNSNERRSSNVGMVHSSSNSGSLGAMRSSSSFSPTGIKPSSSASSNLHTHQLSPHNPASGWLHKTQQQNSPMSSQPQRNQLSSHDAPSTSQPAQRSRVHAVISSTRLQLQSLSEVEEMDVRLDVSEGPPRYSQIFPRTEGREETVAGGQRSERSPFSFNSERRVPNQADKRMAFNQLSSWPNFK